MPPKLSRSPTQKAEESLANQLKELCYANGKEKDPKQSAGLLHKLGLLYKARCHNKMCLIQSAALMNAAIVRKPDDINEVRKDLDSLCDLVVKMAGVKGVDVDLVTASQTCKKAIRQYRNEVKAALLTLNHISESKDKEQTRKLEKQKIKKVQKIQDSITEAYTSIMSYLSDYCISVMGDPPSHCRFALVGMGSLARREVTPYSDFENVIVLEDGARAKENYSEIVEYFRWFAVIFQIILINLGETIIPSVAIRTLNDFSKADADWFFDAYTPCGVSFDGLMPHACKAPLGRSVPTPSKPWTTELIKPVNEMANYLDSDESLKNGYHLADVLSRTCFVSGDRHVYEDFSSRAAGKLASARKSNSKFMTEIRKQVMDDHLKFDINENCSNLYTSNKFNMKQVIYRSTTIFISALGTLHGIEENSCFTIVDRLKDKGIISSQESHCLKYAVAIACEIRLKIYMKRRRQSDLIEDRSNLGRQLAEILNAVGGKCVADYFTIARGFQAAMSNINFADEKSSLRLNLQIDYRYSVDICCKLRLHETCIQICNGILKSRGNHLTAEDKASCHYYTGMSLLDLEKINEARKHFEKELQMRLVMRGKNDNELIADCYYNLGRCFVGMTKYKTALAHFEHELVIRKKITKNEAVDTDIAFCVGEIGMCLANLQRGEEALRHFQTALNIRKATAKDKNADMHVTFCLSQLALCFSKIKRFSDALAHFEQELEMRRKLSSDEESDLQVASCLDNIGLALLNLKMFEQALPNFEQSLFIRQKVKPNKEKNVAIATCIYNISICKKFIENSNINTDKTKSANNSPMPTSNECKAGQKECETSNVTKTDIICSKTTLH